MKKFETKEEFLLDALEYYTKDSRRRCTSRGACTYSPTNSAKNGISEGCIIGRHLSRKNQLLADNIGEDTNIKHILETHSTLIPLWIRNFGGDFLLDCQLLHDNSANWNSVSGLNSIGISSLKTIIREYNLNEDLFKQYIT